MAVKFGGIIALLILPLSVITSYVAGTDSLLCYMAVILDLHGVTKAKLNQSNQNHQKMLKEYITGIFSKT